MAEGDLLSTPAAATGLTPASASTAWGTPSWVEVVSAAASTLYVLGVEWHLPYVAANDRTIQHLIELGTGANGSETVQVQLPYAHRRDTAVGYYPIQGLQVWLPEPFEVAQGTRLAVRIWDSVASAITYAGVKVWYRQGATTVTAVVKDLLMPGLIPFARA